ncbi:MAG: type II toxin-antitoxin system RelE/ParE family toxin [Rubrivivax sp.]
MNVVKQTEEFRSWREGLGSSPIAQRVRARLTRLELGNAGDAKNVGGGVIEMRIDFGPGYRMYYTRIGKVIYLMLCGGDKRSQQADIDRAKALAAVIARSS